MNDVRAGTMARARTARAVADLVAVPLAVEHPVGMEMRVRLAPAEPVEQGDPTGAGDQIVRERRVAHPPVVKVVATRGVSAIRS